MVKFFFYFATSVVPQIGIFRNIKSIENIISRIDKFIELAII